MHTMLSKSDRTRNMQQGETKTMKKLMLSFAILALAIASADTYRVTLRPR
jgi:hypothetical protein